MAEANKPPGSFPVFLQTGLVDKNILYLCKRKSNHPSLLQRYLIYKEERRE